MDLQNLFTEVSDAIEKFIVQKSWHKIKRNIENSNLVLVSMTLNQSPLCTKAAYTYSVTMWDVGTALPWSYVSVREEWELKQT